ncbi:InlB B-repeat-containing protein [Bifidobacterium sp. SO1]|uniref:InlB B-repeat-containing protein n=1 Tax=Bifidobacterium sp. SO1 TaxID=2809029 RepID=UPI001BDD4F69|nr:InlB B-repeat-containing protein [Bifidobacterium sp. SO1]
MYIPLIRFDGNGATSGKVDADGPHMQNNNVGGDWLYTMRSSPYQRTGYTFKGWNTKKDGTGTAYKPGQVVNMGKPATLETMKRSNRTSLALYAQWAQNITITYNGNGSTGGSTASQTTGKGVNVTLRKNGFTRTNYTFTGWNTRADGKGTPYAQNTAHAFNASTTLYAQWKINQATIKYNGNGATGGSTAAQTTNIGTQVWLRANGFSRTNYTFVRWNTRADGKGTNYAPGAKVNMPAGGMTLYAQWKINQATIKYDGNGATGGSTASQTANIGSTVKARANGFSRTNYSFVKWNTKKDGTGTSYSPNANITMPAGGATLYAIWKINQATIKYDGNGATGGSTASQTANIGSSVALRANGFTRTNYSFVRWNTKKDGTGTNYTPGAKLNMPAGGATLYAIWKINQATIKYDGNGATGGSTASQTANIGSSVKAQQNGFTWNDHLFKRWNTKKDGTGTNYTPGSNVTVPAGGMTVYAIWVETVPAMPSTGGFGLVFAIVSGVAGLCACVAVVVFKRRRDARQ